MPVTLKTMSMKYRDNPSDQWSSALVQSQAELEPVQNMIGIVVNGARPSQAVSAGQYVIVKNSTITGITDGLYTAKNALTTSSDVTAADLNAEVTNGGLNDLKNTLVYSQKLTFPITVDANRSNGINPFTHSDFNIPGYTPIGIIEFSTNNEHLLTVNCGLENNIYAFYIRNISNGQITADVNLKILYIKSY